MIEDLKEGLESKTKEFVDRYVRLPVVFVVFILHVRLLIQIKGELDSGKPRVTRIQRDRCDIE
jgi:hypothetical protein